MALQSKFYRKERFVETVNKHNALHDFRDKKRYGLSCPAVGPKDASRRVVCSRKIDLKNNCCLEWECRPALAWTRPIRPDVTFAAPHIKHILGSAENRQQRIWCQLHNIQKNELDFKSMTRCDGWLHRHAPYTIPSRKNTNSTINDVNSTGNAKTTNRLNKKVTHAIDYAPTVLRQYSQNPRPSLMGARCLFEFATEAGLHPKEFENLINMICVRPKRAVKGNIVRPRHEDILHYAYGRKNEPESRNDRSVEEKDESELITDWESEGKVTNDSVNLHCSPFEKNLAFGIFDQAVTGTPLNLCTQPKKSKKSKI